MAKMNKVCVNLDQSNANNGGFTDAEKAQARANIGAGTGNSNSTIVHDSNTLPPVTTNVNQLTVFNDGRTRFDNLYRGVIPSEPSQSESGRVLVANYAGSPAKGTAQWKDVHNIGLNEVPIGGSNGQVLTWNNNGYSWNTLTIPSYTAGSGIDITNDQISWEYTVGRNLHINQNNQIQTNLPGGLYNAPASQSNSFAELTDASGNRAEFAGAYRLSCRHNPNDTYELALKYTASGMTGTITFTGTETVIMTDNSMSIHPAAYIAESTYYTPSRRFGADSGSTIFDPSVHKAIIYQGVAQIGPTSNTQIAIWQDNGAIKISFTSIEVGRVGSTL